VHFIAVGKKGRSTLAFRGYEALGEYTGWSDFVTGQVARIDLRSQAATIVNAGHPLPLRLRDGEVTPVALEADPPFGIVRDFDYRVQRLPLEPGDRLVFLTDGLTERNPVDVEGLILAGAALHPREAVQQLVHAVLEATGGPPEDDATVMCVDWHGGPPRERSTDSGADE